MRILPLGGDRAGCGAGLRLWRLAPRTRSRGDRLRQLGGRLLGLAGELQEGGGGGRDLAGRDHLRSLRRDLQSFGHLARPQAASSSFTRTRSHGARRMARRGRPSSGRTPALFKRIEARVRRARRGDRRDLGAGDRFRRQQRQRADRSARWRRSPMTAGARDFFTDELMSALKIVQRGDLVARRRCAAPGPANWARPSSCLVLSEVRRRLRPQRPARPDPQHGRRARLDRQLPQGLRLEAGQPWGEGTANFQVLLQWNKSTVYSETIAHFASQLAGG